MKIIFAHIQNKLPQSVNLDAVAVPLHQQQHGYCWSGIISHVYEYVPIYVCRVYISWWTLQTPCSA